MRGIANAARNLNASIQNDTLIITRLGYDFETGEEREEPFVKIPLVQIQSLADVLAVDYMLSLIHISEPTRQAEISYAVFCLKKKKKKKRKSK